MFSEILSVDLDLIALSELRPKRAPRRPSVSELRQVRALGQLSPIVVRAIPDTQPRRWELLRGYTQWMAAQATGFDQVRICPVQLDDVEAATFIKEDNPDYPEARIDPIGEAEYLQELLDTGAARSIAEAGRLVGVSRTEASHRLRLLRLDPWVQAQVRGGRLTLGAARALVTLSWQRQREVAQTASKHSLSVREIEAMAAGKGEGGGVAAPTRKDSPEKDPNIAAVEQRLTESLGLPVEIDYAEGAGEMRIRFFGLDEIEGVLDKLGYVP